MLLSVMAPHDIYYRQRPSITGSTTVDLALGEYITGPFAGTKAVHRTDLDEECSSACLGRGLQSFPVGTSIITDMQIAILTTNTGRPIPILHIMAKLVSVARIQVIPS